MKRRIVVVNPTKCSEGTTIASSHLARWIANRLGVPLIDDEENFTDAADIAIFVNGMWQFCNFRKNAFKLAESVRGLIYLANDYAIMPPTQIKRRKHIRIANFENNDKHPSHCYVNWNKLTHKPHNLEQKHPKHEGLFYYGAFREDRIKSFNRYLFGDLPYVATVAGSQKSSAAFLAHAPKLRSIGTCEPMVTPGLFQASLYIEDEKTHQHYHSPANRFYEMLSAGSLILFDAKCLATFMRAGIEIRPWVVSNREDVAKALQKSDELRAMQFSALAHGKNYLRELELEFDEAVKKIKLLD